jgi:metal-responsive CopG/Arc/MetJ family transcriptional regulator
VAETGRKRGRPSTGRDRAFSVRWPAELIARIDAWAAREQMTRSQAIRKLVIHALDAGARG